MNRESLDKRETIQKIEYIACDLLRQICISDKKPLKNVVLNANNDDETSPRLTYQFSKTRVGKLARDITVLAKIKKLLEDNGSSSKRDIFYDDKNLYKIQAAADRSITAACSLLDRTRSELNVTSCSRGFMMGALSFIDDRGECVVTCHSSTIPISDSLLSLHPLCRAKFILVVEKDATFQQMITQRYFDFFKDSVLVTGRGYPDICTRNVLSWLTKTLHLPIFGLFDGDPHGMDIYLTYKYGGTKERVEARGARIQSMRWIGIRRSDERTFPIAQHQKIPLKNSDYVRMKSIRLRAETFGEYDIVNEVDFLREVRTKVELEAFTSGGGESDLLNRRYLVPRIEKAVKEFRMRDEFL